MPQPYHAQLGGIEGSGIYPKPNQAPDWASIAQAISGGASSLLQGAYVRKMGQARLALEQRRLDQEHELHVATLAATNEWRNTQAALRQQSIAAPAGRALQQQKDAFNALVKIAPDHTLVKANADGTPAEFDPNVNYTGPLKDVMSVKDKADAETLRQKDRIDSLTKAAQLRDWVQQQKQKETAGGPGKPVTAAQSRLQKNDFLTRLGALSGGDPQKAADIVANDKDVQAAASKLGVQDYEIRGSAIGYSDKKAGSSSTSVQSIDPKTGTTTTRTQREKTPGSGGTPPAPDATLPSWMSPTTPAGPITPLAVPKNGQVQLPPPAPGPVPQGGEPPSPQGAAAAAQMVPLTVPTPAPAAAAPAAPTAIPKLNLRPAPVAPSAAAPAAPVKPIDETTLSDAALWEVKRVHGLSPDQATAYVKARQKPTAPAAAAAAPVAPATAPTAPVAPIKPPVPEEEEEPAPSGV